MIDHFTSNLVLLAGDVLKLSSFELARSKLDRTFGTQCSVLGVVRGYLQEIDDTILLHQY